MARSTSPAMHPRRLEAESPRVEPTIDAAQVEELKKTILAPMDLYEEHKGKTTDPNINPHFMMRLQKIMDEYAGGVSAQFFTSEPLLTRGQELLEFLKEDSLNLAAEDLHELMRVWENIHRMWQAEAHVQTMLFREETRWPGYYFRKDKPALDEANWKVFANLTWNPQSKEWDGRRPREGPPVFIEVPCRRRISAAVRRDFGGCFGGTRGRTRHRHQARRGHCEANGATCVALFGSRARGDASPDSDVDLLVCFGRPVSLVTLVPIQ
ncbi:MAG: nucleotidyltransferase domain-containing protein [Candidatus Krumholzibacteriia bacterium]